MDWLNIIHNNLEEENKQAEKEEEGKEQQAT